MNIGGMTTALTLLNGDLRPSIDLTTLVGQKNADPGKAQNTSTPIAQPVQEPKGSLSSNWTMAQQEDSEAQIKEFLGVMNGLKDGSLSPLSDKAINSGIYGVGRPPPSPSDDPRMMEQGLFAYASEPAADTEAGQAKFADRQVAMLNAYHYGSELSASAQQVAELSNAVAKRQDRLDAVDTLIAKGGAEGEAAKAYKEQLTEFGGGYGRELASAERGLDRASAMLKSQFGFTVDVVQKDADGQNAPQGFEVRHETFGLMMSVDAEGAVTLYDGSGKGYAAANYNAANSDAFIPELHNDEIRRADSEAPVQERFARMEERVSRLEASQGMDIRR